MDNLQLNLNPETQLVTVDDPSPTISVIWDRAIQQAVIKAISGPTIASRAYGMVHTAVYDAWSAYENIPISTNLNDDLQRPEAENTLANKTEAMSYSAYVVSIALFPEHKAIFDRVMSDLGYETTLIDLESPDPTTPPGIGIISAEALLDYRDRDGANQLGREINGDGTPYSDYTNYQPINDPGNITQIDSWTPDILTFDDGKAIAQSFLTPHWGRVTTFSVDRGDRFRPAPPEPFLLVAGEVDLQAKTITLEDGIELDISPALIGTIINPEFIAQTEEVIDYSANLTDEQKLIAEFWEDGGGTSFPPGTWMTFGQYVSARDDNTLDEDARMFFTLGNAVFDAGIATWESKVYYDYTRPVSAIRELGKLDLIGEYDEQLDGYAIEAYGDYGSGTEKILAEDFITYQTPHADYSPPFAEYTSGHSAFSAASAEVLREYTGRDYFGASVTFNPGESRFEPDIMPMEAITLDWDTFSEAADQAGMSRLYGGIHFSQGDLNGREIGREVGQAVIDRTEFYINGGNGNDRDEEEILGSNNDSIIFELDKLFYINNNWNSIKRDSVVDLFNSGRAVLGTENNTDRLFDYLDGVNEFLSKNSLILSDLFSDRNYF
ncbi:vanadium-dependent haloperoxidase [Waterburya agarophytonicola K14]|uniref:Vanadium-dependent haloperoxidase n=1 Tax=Waterburya agarophytonicola KI4 TaxID=2874699 RepID=A0A964BQ71_9CYAN|nr:vanadium-dependent haloperoxidase [Waterburya agarophytonicola]MCC0177279.1 vanadium-dependent haloperoxidase [Waterburya agarophytonicola KI4]